MCEQTTTATLQELLQQQLASYTDTHLLDGQRLKVCRHLLTCQTEVLGGLQYQCDRCHADVPRYHSCRDRHCPQCQWRASRHWSERQQRKLLPVTYYHLVFTLPHALNGWVQLHPQVLYRLLFQSVWRTLSRFGADPKRLGGRLGMTAVLHTWGQNLSRHVHLHCLIPGGVLTADGNWKAARSTYLFPVRALSRHYRGSFVSALRAAANADKLQRVTGDDVDAVLDRLMQTEWVVYAKPCLSRSESIVRYLARYSHRIAISNQRIESIEDGQVRFSYRDYRDGQTKQMTLEADEFIRRYLQHVLPKGFMRIRHYGFLANCCRERARRQIRAALNAPDVSDTEVDEESRCEQRCPRCHKGRLRLHRLIKPGVHVVLEPG
jgi:hypothetical protein